tara:strand:+ start:10059 stop:21233 length:11175 start_codon:yes stop_codon:yes gene_type:complete
MARSDSDIIVDLRLRVDKAERELARFARKAERTQINLKGIDHRKFTQPLGKITGSVSEFNKSLEASNARVIAFTASAGVLFTVTRAFSEMAKAAIEVEKTLADVNVILNQSERNLKKFGAGLFDIAKKTGQSFYEVGEAAGEFARQGLSMEKTLTRTRDALILMRLSGMDAQSAVSSLTAAINSFNKTALTSTEIINKMANVDAAFAVSTNDLAEAIRRVGASAEGVNVTFNELLATVTSVQQTTARGGNVIGNSLKTIFTRIQRTEVINQLKFLGVQVKETSGEMRPAMNILRDLAKAYQGLTPQLKAQTAELVGGVYQMNILKALLKDLGSGYSVYSQALSTANNSTDEAIRRNAQLNKTMAAMLNETVQNLTKMGSEIGKMTFEPVFKKLLGSFNKLAEETEIFGDIGSFFGFDEKEAGQFGKRLGEGIFKSIGNFLQGPGLVALVSIAGKLFIDFTKFLGKSTIDMMNLNKNSQQQAAIQQQIQAILQNSPQLVQQIETKEKSRLTVEREILMTLKDEIRAREAIARLSKTMAPGVVAGGVGAKIDKSAGTTTLVKRGYAGFIPNFRGDAMEMMGAIAGGYTPGDVRQKFIPNYGQVTYNTAEKIKHFPNFKQPAIMPPAGSKAGKNYRNNFESQHGFNPYASGGFVPNLMEVLTSLRTIFHKKGSGSTGKMDKKLSATREQLVSSQGTPAWLKPILGYALTPGEKVNIHTMGQLSGVTARESAGFATGTGRAADLKGRQMESAIAGRPGMFGINRYQRDPNITTPKTPYDLGQRAGGRNFPVESKPELKTKQIAQIFAKTLYENNSSSLRHLRRRLSSKKGDPQAEMLLDKLQRTTGKAIGNRDTEISKYTAGEMNSLREMNAAMGFDTKNAIAAHKQGLFHSGGLIPNFATKHGKAQNKSGPARNIGQLATMLVPQAASVANRTHEFIYKGSKYSVPVRGYSKNKMKSGKGFEGLHSATKQALTGVANQYSGMIDPPLGAKMDPSKYYNKGAIAAAVGTLFESAINAAFSRNVDKEGVTWDVRRGTKGTGSVRRLFSDYKTPHADFKNSTSMENLRSMAKKYENERGARKAYGFVPNFSPLQDAFETEKRMGGKPVLDYHPTVGYYVRDGKTQGNFGDVKRDHPEGIPTAIRNSKKMQDALAAEGHVPNFAEGGAGTGLDFAAISAGAAMAGFGFMQLSESSKTLAEAQRSLSEKVNEARKAEATASKELQAEIDRTQQKYEKNSRVIEQHTQRTQKLTELQAKKAAVDAKPVGKDAIRRETMQAMGLDKNTKVSSLSPEQKAEYKGMRGMAEEDIRKRRAAAVDKEINQINQEINESKKSVGKARSKNAAIDKTIAGLNEELAAHKKNSAAINKEAAAHNATATKTSQMVAGTGGTVEGAPGKGGKYMNFMSGGGAMAGMMMMPMIGGTARALGPQDTAGKMRTEAAVSGVESGANFAMMGAMTGNPYLAIIGGVVGGFQALSGVLDSQLSVLPDLTAAHEKAKQKLTDFNNSSQKFLTAFGQMEEAIADPNMKPEDFAKRQKALDDALMEIPADMQAKIAAAKGDTEKIKELFSSMAKELQDRERQTAGRKEFAQELDEERGWFVDWTRKAARWAGMDVQRGDRMFGEGTAGSRRQEAFSNRLFREVDSEMLKGNVGDVNVAALERFVGDIGKEMDQSEMASFVALMQELGVPEGYIDDVKELGKNEEDAAEAAQDLAEKVRTAKDAFDSTAAAAERQKRLQAINHQYRMQMQKVAEETKIVNAVLANRITMEKEYADTLRKLQENRLKFGVDLAAMRAGKLYEGSKPFLGDIEDEQYKTLIGLNKIVAENIIKNRDAITKATDEVWKITNEQMTKANEKLATIRNQQASGQSEDTKMMRDASRAAALQQALLPVIEAHLKSIKDNPADFDANEKFVGRLYGAFKEAGIENAKVMAEKFSSDFSRVESSLQNELAIIADETLRQRMILEEESQLQKEILRAQERMASYGGIKDFMGPAGLALMPKNFEKIHNIFESQIKGFYSAQNGARAFVPGRAGSGEMFFENPNGSIGRGRDAMNTLDTLINNLKIRGTTGERLGPEAFGPLVGQSMHGVMESLRLQTLAAKSNVEDITGMTIEQLAAKQKDAEYARAEKLAETDPNRAAIIRRDADRNNIAASFKQALSEEGRKRTAAEQIGQQLKMKEIPDQIIQMNTGIKALNRILEIQGNELERKNRSAFISALRTVGMDKLAADVNDGALQVAKERERLGLRNANKISQKELTEHLRQRQALDATIWSAGNATSATMSIGANNIVDSQRHLAKQSHKQGYKNTVKIAEQQRKNAFEVSKEEASVRGGQLSALSQKVTGHTMSASNNIVNLNESGFNLLNDSLQRMMFLNAEAKTHKTMKDASTNLLDKLVAAGTITEEGRQKYMDFYTKDDVGKKYKYKVGDKEYEGIIGEEMVGTLKGLNEQTIDIFERAAPIAIGGGSNLSNLIFEGAAKQIQVLSPDLKNEINALGNQGKLGPGRAADARQKYKLEGTERLYQDTGAISREAGQSLIQTASKGGVVGDQRILDYSNMKMISQMNPVEKEMYLQGMANQDMNQVKGALFATATRLKKNPVYRPMPGQTWGKGGAPGFLVRMRRSSEHYGSGIDYGANSKKWGELKSGTNLGAAFHDDELLDAWEAALEKHDSGIGNTIGTSDPFQGIRKWASMVRRGQRIQEGQYKGRRYRKREDRVGQDPEDVAFSRKIDYLWTSLGEDAGGRETGLSKIRRGINFGGTGGDAGLGTYLPAEIINDLVVGGPASKGWNQLTGGGKNIVSHLAAIDEFMPIWVDAVRKENAARRGRQVDAERGKFEGKSKDIIDETKALDAQKKSLEAYRKAWEEFNNMRKRSLNMAGIKIDDPSRWKFGDPGGVGISWNDVEDVSKQIDNRMQHGLARAGFLTVPHGGAAGIGQPKLGDVAQDPTAFKTVNMAGHYAGGMPPGTPLARRLLALRTANIGNAANKNPFKLGGDGLMLGKGGAFHKALMAGGFKTDLFDMGDLATERVDKNMQLVSGFKATAKEVFDHFSEQGGFGDDLEGMYQTRTIKGKDGKEIQVPLSDAGKQFAEKMVAAGKFTKEGMSDFIAELSATESMLKEFTELNKAGKEARDRVKQLMEWQQHVAAGRLTQVEFAEKEKELLKKHAAIQEENARQMYKAGEAQMKMALADPTASQGQRIAAVAKRRQDAIKAAKFGDSFDLMGKEMKERWTMSSRDMARQSQETMLQIGDTFRDGITDAVWTWINGTKDIKESFKELFENIGNMAAKMVIKMALQQFLFNPIMGMGMKRGGLVKGYNEGGYVNQGIRGVDTVPARLSKGEFVIKASSVDKVGLDFLNSLNNGGPKGYNIGGVIRSGHYKTNQLLTSALMAQGILGRSGGGSAAAGKAGGRPFDASLYDPLFGSDPDPQSGIKSFARHGRHSAFIQLKNAFQYGKDGTSGYDIDTRLSQFALTDPDNRRNKFRMDKAANLMEARQQRYQQLKEWEESVAKDAENKKKKMSNMLWMMGGIMLLSQMASPAMGGRRPFSTDGPGPFGKWARGRGKAIKNWFGGAGAGGGAGMEQGMMLPGGGRNPAFNNPRWRWPASAELNMGGSIEDTESALLSKGEYVVPKNTVDKLGVAFFDNLNRTGRIKGYAEGGYVGDDSGPQMGSESLSGATNNINITVNIDKNGQTSSDTAGEGLNEPTAKRLGEMIKGQVMNVIVNQKRPGGVLYDGNISGT